jgi:hypothetical protein
MPELARIFAYVGPNRAESISACKNASTISFSVAGPFSITSSSRQDQLLASPAQFCYGLEFTDGQCAALVPGFRAGCGERFEDIRALGFVNFKSLKVLVQENHQDRVPVLLYIYGAEPLTWLAAQQAAAFYLQVPSLPVLVLDSIVSGLARRRELNAKKPAGFVFGNFPQQRSRP